MLCVFALVHFLGNSSVCLNMFKFIEFAVCCTGVNVYWNFLADTCRQCEGCQDDSVNCSSFRKDKMKLNICSIHVRARVRMRIVQLSCACRWTS